MKAICSGGRSEFADLSLARYHTQLMSERGELGLCAREHEVPSRDTALLPQSIELSTTDFVYGRLLTCRHVIILQS